MSERPRDWNAASYQRVSAPLEAMGREVLDRLELRGDERVLDAGCGTGRVTAALVERLPRGQVVAVDGSPSMVEQARERLGPGVEVFVADLLELELDEPVDAILSTATFHWIADHDRLFERLFAALRPGGRIVAQCGGAGNVATVQAAIDAVAEPALEGWAGPWNFQSPARTAARLERIGFTEHPHLAAGRARRARRHARVPRHRDARLPPRADPGGAARRVRRGRARGAARAGDRLRPPERDRPKARLNGLARRVTGWHAPPVFRHDEARDRPGPPEHATARPAALPPIQANALRLQRQAGNRAHAFACAAGM